MKWRNNVLLDANGHEIARLEPAPPIDGLPAYYVRFRGALTRNRNYLGGAKRLAEIVAKY